jgi:hypothetical protein
VKTILVEEAVIYELCRTLGSLIYANSFYLNDKNLSKLLDETFNCGLLNSIRDKIEYSMAATQIENAIVDLDRLDLITSQLAYNLSMPVKAITSTLGTVDSIGVTTPNKQCFIDDRFKINCLNLLVRILKFHVGNIDSLIEQAICDDKSKNIHSNEQRILNTYKILIKCLQGIENLLLSVETTNQSSWMHSNSSRYRLGDILTIVNELGYCGIRRPMAAVLVQTNLTNKTSQLNSNEILAFITERLLPEQRENNTEDEYDLNNESKTCSSKEAKKQQTTKLSLQTKKKSSQGNFKKSSKKYNQQQIEFQQKLVPSEDQSKINNSVIYLKDNQVPLLSHLCNNNGCGDSEISESSGEIPSKKSTEKATIKVRVVAFSVLLTAFQVGFFSSIIYLY